MAINTQILEERSTWTREEILTLISLYKKYQQSFRSTTVKNDKIWQQIASELKTHTHEQCKNKFKYLKQKYTEKKDNMGPRKTGEKNIKFDYFHEFDELFGSDANINPRVLASSARGSCNLPSENIENDENQQVNHPKKRKRSMLEKQLQNFEENLKQREDSKNERHREILRRQDEALKVFDRMAHAFEKIVEKQ